MSIAKFIQQTYSGCGFVHSIAKKTEPKPDELGFNSDRLIPLLKIIKDNKNITGKVLTEKSPYSQPTTSKYVKVLLDQNKITRIVVGHVGKSEKCTYSAVKYND